MYFCGFNGFRQFPNQDLKRTEPTEFKVNDENEVKCQVISISWAYNIYALSNEIIVSGFMNGEPMQLKKLSVEDEITEICSNDKFALVLLRNGNLYKLNQQTCLLEKINFENIVEIEKYPKKRSIFGELVNASGDAKHSQAVENSIEHIACGESMFIVITKSNAVYSIPTKVHQFPKHLKIKKLVCGFEHSIVLTANGDVFTWGNGLRGQLGHPSLEIHETPILVDALAGLKIIGVSAGGWHSAAISTFGDLYVWGSNVNGQLGMKITRRIGLNVEKQLIRKNPTVFPLPQLLDLNCSCSMDDVLDAAQISSNECSAVKVYTGARHTFVQMACGKLLCAGWNEHGQLGIEQVKNQDSFIELKLCIVARKIICGPWSTVFIT